MLSTKNCIVRFSDKLGVYTVEMGRDIPYVQRVNFKFVTGVSDTYVTISSLFNSKEMAAKALVYLDNRIWSGNCIGGKGNLAIGDKRVGILCSIKDFAFEGLEPFTFYFYLIITAAYPKAVLGVDFISCCDHWSNPGGDINITRFSEEEYKKGFSASSMENALDIESALEDISSIKLSENFNDFKTESGQIDLQKFIDSFNFGKKEQYGAKRSFSFLE